MPSYSSHLLCCQSAQHKTLLLGTYKGNHVYVGLYRLHVYLILVHYALPHWIDKTLVERQQSWLNHVGVGLVHRMTLNQAEPRQLSSLHWIT